VRLVRLGTGDAERVLTVGAAGTVRFDSLLQGRYAVSADRTLSAAELARLSPTQRDASVFAGGTQVNVTPPTARATEVALVAARRGSLVISELFSYAPGPPVFYVFGNYVEVYNNSDSTVFLDGVLLFRTSAVTHSNVWGPCNRTEEFRLDTVSVWAGLIWAFLGDGRQYPMSPGFSQGDRNGRIKSSSGISRDGTGGLVARGF